MCTGTIGTFTANEAKKALHLLRWVILSLSLHPSIKTLISVVPLVLCLYLTPTNINNDPINVYLKKK
jgi:hypothetical protein